MAETDKTNKRLDLIDKRTEVTRLTVANMGDDMKELAEQLFKWQAGNKEGLLTLAEGIAYTDARLLDKAYIALVGDKIKMAHLKVAVREASRRTTAIIGGIIIVLNGLGWLGVALGWWG